jgi:hypothetical protein
MNHRCALSRRQNNTSDGTKIKTEAGKVMVGKKTSDKK